MRLIPLFSLLLVALTQQCQRPPSEPSTSRVSQVKALVQRDLTGLRTLVGSQLLPLARRGTDSDSMHGAFRTCRLAYKRVEAFTEYFMPATTRLVNGPPLEEIEPEENQVFEPGGFQVIEGLLFPTFDTTARTELVHELRKLDRELIRYEALWEALEFTDAHVFDALRLQVFRLETLGLSGFDTPLCGSALPEAATSLAALREYLRIFQANAQRQQVENRLLRAESVLRKKGDFDAFDRMAFLVEHANPLTRDLLAYQKSVGIVPFLELRALRGDAGTLFEPGAFNPDFYAPDANSYRTAARVELGRRLFHDPVLSGNGTRSCASCHQPNRAFTDGQAKSVTLTGVGTVARNAPTLLNAALQNGQFYDLRGVNLEGQTRDVIENKAEMHGSLDGAVQRLRHRRDYTDLFCRAYPEARGGLQTQHLQNALASYERSLLSLNSRFDRYVRGERAALNRQEIRGFNLFMGKAKCGICHFMPLFNGTVPPDFTRSEAEVIGVPVAPNARRIDPDPGRYALHRVAPWRFAFKTPTVRNAALTAPYMHNGAFRTLEQVVDFYDRGGGNGLGFNLPNQTLPEEQLHLSKAEKAALVAFMKSLTDAPGEGN